MYLSKRQNGFYYVFYFQANGKKTCISTRCKTKSEANKFLTRFESEIAKRETPKAPLITFHDYVGRFISYSKTIHTIKTQKAYEQSLTSLKKFLGVIHLKEITSLQMSNYFEQRIKNSSIYQARKDLICINSFFNKAIAEGYIDINPCKRIKRFRIPQKQPLFFSGEEFKKLIREIKEPDIRDIVSFAVFTGLRQMELITLLWTQVNLERKYLILDNIQHITKSKKIRTIPLSNDAFQILSVRVTHSIKNINPGLVFTYNLKPISPSTLTSKFKSYVRSSGINENLSFHSLRHTFASWLVQKGVSIFIVSKLLGHSNVSVTEIYSHLRTEDLENAINKLNESD